MGCGCNKRQDQALAGTTLRSSTNLEANSAGVYDISSAPGCTEAYYGAFSKANVHVYVVDINGPNETFFVRGDRNQATQLARTERLKLDVVHPSNLCHETMVALFGA